MILVRVRKLLILLTWQKVLLGRHLSNSQVFCFRVWWLRWTSGEDGCWFSGSHCFSSEQGLKTASNQIVKLFQPQISEGDSARWACSGVWDDRSWCQPRASNQHHNQAASKQGISSKWKYHLPPNHLHLLLLIQIVIYIVHIPWSNLSKVVVHFPDLGLSDSWTIVQLKELFRWVFSSKRFCRRLSEWNAKFSFWKWNTE